MDPILPTVAAPPGKLRQRTAEDRQLFVAADEDQDGRLTPMELRQVLYPETHEVSARKHPKQRGISLEKKGRDEMRCGIDVEVAFLDCRL